MTNEEFIHENRQQDPKLLALKKCPEGVDLKFCLQQIEGWQTARRKIPRWSEVPGVLFPPRISMEQCSSQQTAEYKRCVAERLLPEGKHRSFVDLTGGFGIDFSFLSTAFEASSYVEAQPHLCEIARENFRCLGLKGVHVVCGSAETFDIPNDTDLVYLDPARRDAAGRKVVALEDCSPNLVSLQDALLASARMVMVKLSPMLDISEALRRLKHVCEVHVVAVEGECKELLFVLSAAETHPLTFHCAELSESGGNFVCDQSVCQTFPELVPQSETLVGGWLHEPNAAILKAHVQEALAEVCGLRKLHPQSNLYFSRESLTQHQGLYRSFRIVGCSGFGKREMKDLLGDLKQANLTIRNFPSTVADLRKRLRLREGGNAYLFASTLSDGEKVLLRCVKP